MRAVVVEGHLRFVRDCPIPEAPPGWARIRVRLAGICGTDMEFIKGYRGFKGISRRFRHISQMKRPCSRSLYPQHVSSWNR